MSKANEQSQHTPGPWTLSSATDDGYRRINSRDWGALAEVVVMLEGEGSLGFYISEQGEANARLIAAAPELLEACRQVVEWYENSGPSEPAIGSANLWSKCKKAIAKAEGRS